MASYSFHMDLDDHLWVNCKVLLKSDHLYFNDKETEFVLERGISFLLFRLESPYPEVVQDDTSSFPFVAFDDLDL